MDINGPEMHTLFKFAKRGTRELFTPRFGMASHIYDYNSKFLFDRLGEVRHFYTPKVELAVIEADIKELLRQEFVERKYQELIDPPDGF